MIEEEIDRMPGDGDAAKEADGQPVSEDGETDDDVARLEEALREKDQFRSLAQRIQADLENYKKRASQEREELMKFGQSQVILKILAVSDDFRRAMEMVPDDVVAPGWQEGLGLVQAGIDHLLETEGVTKIEAEGRPFEPAEHEAVFFQETDDEEAGRVLSVIRDGYRLHGRVLRAAQVAVSKTP